MALPLIYSKHCQWYACSVTGGKQYCKEAHSTNMAVFRHQGPSGSCSPGACSRKGIRSSKPVDINVELVACFRHQVEGAALAGTNHHCAAQVRTGEGRSAQGARKDVKREAAIHVIAIVPMHVLRDSRACVNRKQRCSHEGTGGCRWLSQPKAYDCRTKLYWPHLAGLAVVNHAHFIFLPLETL